ncbi:SET domain-containing protein, partial [Clavulina sp. PMI_390]
TVIATRAISADTCILSCPFDLAITKDLAFGAVKACVWDATHMLETEVSKALPDRIDRLNERQIICAYIGLHWVCTDGINNGHLKHRPYLDVLPDSSDLRTPLHFTPAELALLTGTNLLGATLDRRKEWEHEWREVRDIFVDAVLSWGEGLTWDRWLTAATYLSSRAFPSSLLSPNPTKTMVSDASSYPVLLPILDCLNHARGHPVSWVVTSNPPKAAIPRPATTPTVSEVFNNYGPKPNSELLLGYGFVLPSNPEDTIVLKLGGRSSTSSAHPPDLFPEPSAGLASLWDEVEKTVLSAGDDDESVTSVTSMEGGWEVALEVCEALDGMIRNKIGALPDMSEVPHLPSAGIRVDVRGMVAEYVKGQKEILEGILEYVELRKMGAIEKARASGLDVREMPEDEEEE